MSPKINKGDAVILEKVTKKKELKKGDVVAYKKDKHLVVHRIVGTEKQKGQTVYITRGDLNNSNDAKAVKKSQIKGVVKIRIPIIAWPTVWLTELFYG